MAHRTPFRGGSPAASRTRRSDPERLEATIAMQSVEKGGWMSASGKASQDNGVWHNGHLERPERWEAIGHGGATLWLTGLPASGKSTIAPALERELVTSGRPAYVLDGDNLRHGLCKDLGFDAASRTENVRRVAHVA